MEGHMNEKVKKLYRSKTDKIIAGVCGGMGKYFNTDPLVFRLIFIALTFAGGSGILLYIIFAIIVPEEPDNQHKTEKINDEEQIKENAKSAAKDFKNAARKYGSNREILGIIIIIIGLLLLLNVFLPIVFRWDIIWPVLIILLGIYLISRRS
jgi:phage shock protein C